MRKWLRTFTAIFAAQAAQGAIAWYVIKRAHRLAKEVEERSEAEKREAQEEEGRRHEVAKSASGPIRGYCVSALKEMGVELEDDSNWYVRVLDSDEDADVCPVPIAVPGTPFFHLEGVKLTGVIEGSPWGPVRWGISGEIGALSIKSEQIGDLLAETTNAPE